MKTKTIDRPFQLKELSETGHFKGYASVFGALDSYRDIVMPGAFAKSLAKKAAENRKVPILWQHNSREPIGVHTLLQEDNHGLYIEGQLTRGVQRADEAYLLLKAGALDGISIGYNPVDGGYDKSRNANLLKEVDLWENSLVTFPALDIARVTDVKSLRELETIGECEDWLREAAGLSRDEAKGIIARVKAAANPREADEKLQAVLKSLNDTISSIRS